MPLQSFEDKRVIVVLSCILILSIALGGCGPKALGEYDKSFFALDTVITFKVFGDRSAKKALDKAVERIGEIEDHMSPTKEDSDVSKINKAAGLEPVKVHEDTFRVIERALDYGRTTEGILDITIRPIVELWGITSDNPRVPSEDEIKDKLGLVDYRRVKLDEENMTVFLEDKGMGIDLGAIAKGFAADEAKEILKDGGVKHALLNLGGNVITLGDKPGGIPWRIGLQDPRTEETGKQHFAIVESVDTTIVSSGDYERYITDVYEKTGERYHHIFDPRTGYPAKSGLMSCTVITDSSIDADALSTILYILGHEEGFKALKAFGDRDAIVVTLDRDIYTTNGLKSKLIPSGDEYRIMD